MMETNNQQHSVFTIVAALSNGKSAWFNYSHVYQPFMINRIFGMRNDTTIFANEMNKSYFLPPKIQHDFYESILPKMNRWFPYLKIPKNEEAKLLARHLGVNPNIARRYIPFIDQDLIDEYLISEEKNKEYVSKKLKKMKGGEEESSSSSSENMVSI